MSDFIATGDDLTAVANAIRTKGGTSGLLVFPNGFVQAIGDIQTGITPTGQISINANGTVDVTNYASAVVNVPSNAVVGSVTFSQKYNSNGNRLITTVSDIGFTPTKFYFYLDSLATGTQYLAISASFETISNGFVRKYIRYSNTSGSVQGGQVLTSWTTQSSGYLYFDSGNIYFRTSSSNILNAVKYNWIAVK